VNKEIKQEAPQTDLLKVRKSAIELANLGDGQVAYIKEMTADEAGRMFPAIQGIPKGIALFALHAANGTPLALTDSRQAALAQAIEDDLVIASIH
jgi:hypothetical protein